MAGARLQAAPLKEGGPPLPWFPMGGHSPGWVPKLGCIQPIMGSDGGRCRAQWDGYERGFMRAVHGGSRMTTALPGSIRFLKGRGGDAAGAAGQRGYGEWGQGYRWPALHRAWGA